MNSEQITAFLQEHWYIASVLIGAVILIGAIRNWNWLSRLRSPASTPFPSISPPSKRPLCTFPKPQAGLRSLRIAASQLNKRASFKISRAPFSYCCVTSAPSALITFPSRISAGGRGVGSHPKASGQIGIR